MKINKLLITALSCILLTSCSVKEVQRTSHNQNLDDFQQEFIEKNDVAVLCCNVGDNEEVITFVNDEGYGLATFFYDDAMDNIQYEIIKLDNSFDSRKVHYGQVKGKDNFFIGIFMDETLVDKASSTMVIFKVGDKEQPTKTQQPTSGSTAEIVSYESNERRIIEKIELLDDDNQVLYEIY